MPYNDRDSWNYGRGNPYAPHNPFSAAGVAADWELKKEQARANAWQKRSEPQYQRPQSEVGAPASYGGGTGALPRTRRRAWVIGLILVFGLFWVLGKISEPANKSAPVQTQAALPPVPAGPSAEILDFASTYIPEPCRSQFGSRQCTAVTEEFKSGKYKIVDCWYGKKGFSFWLGNVPSKMVAMAKADPGAQIRRLGSVGIEKCPTTADEAAALSASNRLASGH
jgi:hypothetical protein